MKTMQTNAIEPPGKGNDSTIDCERCGKRKLEVFYRDPKTHEVICIPCEREQERGESIRERLSRL